VSARAGVSRSTFYELFDDLDACVLAVLRQVASRSTALMAKAFAAEASWQDGVLAALAALLESLDREPLLARVCLLEMLAGGPEVLEHRACELAALNPQIAAGIGMPHLGQVSELLARLAHGGLLRKQAGGAGRPNQWWLTPQGEQAAQALEDRRAVRWRTPTPGDAPSTLAS
jgi:AcrR family transcriptional regulator